jgi:hypothetical protein
MGMETLKGETTYNLGDITDYKLKKKVSEGGFGPELYPHNSILGGGWQSQPGTRLSY